MTPSVPKKTKPSAKIKPKSHPALVDSKLKQLTLALKDKNKQLQQMHEVKTEFVSMISHELRTPLTALREDVNLVLEGLVGEINPKQKEFLEAAKKNIDRLISITSNVLDYQKLELGTADFLMRKGNLNDLIMETAKIIRPLIERKSLSFELDLEDNLPTLRFDRNHMRQTLNHLLHNALKFTSRGSIKIVTRKVADQVELVVVDTGVGINLKDRSKIFQEFVQGGKDRSSGGAGLGLAICRAIIERHGGQIWVESDPGQGSRFYISLPLR